MDGSSQPYEYPRLTGRRVALRPIEASDYDWLFRLATSGQPAITWRFRGKTPSPEQFLAMLWQETPLQMVVLDRESGAPTGLVQLIEVDHANGHAALSAIFNDEALRSGWPVEAIFVFVNYAFTLWNLRKIYFEAPDFTFDSFRSAVGPLLVEEGCLREHEHFDGTFMDVHILALYRSTWEQHRPVYARSLAPDRAAN